MFHNFQLTEKAPDDFRKKNDQDVAPRNWREVIRTSFAVEEGETIVVGSSKLNGGEEALLLLLTAIP